MSDVEMFGIHMDSILKDLNKIQGGDPTNDQLYARGRIVDEVDVLLKKIKKLEKKIAKLEKE